MTNIEEGSAMRYFTQAGSGAGVYLNPEHVTALAADLRGTKITTTQGVYIVREDVPEVRRRLGRSA